MRWVRGRRASSGFTLVEVLAAMAVLVVAIGAGSRLLCLAAARTGDAAVRTSCSDAAITLLAGFDMLPYAAASGTPSLVAECFPHARAGDNSSESFFVSTTGGVWPSGSFVSHQAIGSSHLVLVARFLARVSDGSWQPLTVDQVIGRDFVLEPPPTVLRLDVNTVDSRGVHHHLAGRVYTATGAAQETTP